jgi:hypothetical protein
MSTQSKITLENRVLKQLENKGYKKVKIKD